MKWVTREFVHVDRTAVPWLIGNFVDRDPTFIFVAPEGVQGAVEEGAIPFDTKGAELGHHGNFCSFDAVIEKYELRDPALLEMARIVRAADTGKPELAPEGPGLDGIMTGISLGSRDDHEAIARAAPVYDALYAHCKVKLIREKHASELEKMDRRQGRGFLKERLGAWSSP